MLENDDVKLDNMFIASLVFDLIRVRKAFGVTLLFVLYFLLTKYFSVKNLIFLKFKRDL